MKIVIIGLDYVDLPIAVEFDKIFKTMGLDEWLLSNIKIVYFLSFWLSAGLSSTTDFVWCKMDGYEFNYTVKEWKQ